MNDYCECCGEEPDNPKILTRVRVNQFADTPQLSPGGNAWEVWCPECIERYRPKSEAEKA